jgi:hypothetical protein
MIRTPLHLPCCPKGLNLTLPRRHIIANRSYSAQWWSPTDLARWRDEHVRYRGVYFAA